MIKTGYLRQRQTLTTQYDCECHFDFETMDGQTICDVHPPKEVPINRPIEVHFEGKQILKWELLPILERRDYFRKDVALIYVMGEGAQESGDIVERTRLEAIEVEHFYRQTNDGEWDYIRVTPYVVENTTGQNIGLSFRFNDPDIIAQMEEQWPGRSSQHNYFHGRGGFAPGINGHAYLGGVKAWSYGGGVSVVKHEQGHNFGCTHSRSEGNEYGDPTCIMAKSTCGFNGPQTVNLDQILPENVEESDQYHFLVPIECSASDLRPGECQAVTFSTDTERYAITVRKVKEQSILGVSSLYDPGTVFIHKIRRSGETFGTPTFMGLIPLGEYKDILGKKVHAHSMKDGTVQILIGNQSAQSFPTAPEFVEGDEFVSEMSGIWHDSEVAAQGVDLWVIPERNQIVGYWFTYHPQGPHSDSSYTSYDGRNWFMLDGTITNGIAEIEIIQPLEDGTAKNVGYGKMKIADGFLRFNFYSENHGRDHLVLNKLTPQKEQDSLTGIWETGTHQGYAVSKYDDTYVAYYFGYDNIEQQWKIYQGPDPQNLDGLFITSRYKQQEAMYQDDLEQLNLENELANATHILQ